MFHVKLIDWNRKGNVIRLYFCKDEDYDKAWGDDWNDAPWCYNAGIVYDEYVAMHYDLGFGYDYSIFECDEDAGYGINPMFSKEDFKDGKLPAFIVCKCEEWEYSYRQMVEEGIGTQIYLGMDPAEVNKDTSGLWS
jgi:hypothetical protein